MPAYKQKPDKTRVKVSPKPVLDEFQKRALKRAGISKNNSATSDFDMSGDETNYSKLKRKSKK